MSVGVAGFEEYCREGRVLSESDANGNPICDYIYLGKNLVGKRYASGGIYYYHTDPAGTPLAVTDSKAAVVWRGYYEPFGNEYAVQGTASNDVRFAGNKKDDETGLNHFGARYMDSLLGRFVAPDPVGPVDSKTGKINDKILTEPQRLNAYAYALNGPGRYVDRGGKDPILIVAGIAAVTSYLLLHHPDVANTPTSSSDPTYASNGAAGMVDDALFFVMAIEGVEQAATPSPATPVGRNGNPINVPRGTNSDTVIDGRAYEGHALDQMQGRGIPSSVVEDTIGRGIKTPGHDGRTVYTTEQSRVVLNPDGSVKTVYPQ